MNRSAMALGESRVWYLPAGRSIWRVAQSSRWPRPAVIAATSTSVKSRVAWPAQAEPPGSADLALISALPVGWSWRSRSPVEVPRKVLVSECSAYPYSFRPAAAARLVVPAGLAGLRAVLGAERLRVAGPEQPLRILGRGVLARGRLGRGNDVRHLVRTHAVPGHHAGLRAASAAGDRDDGQPAGPGHPVGGQRVRRPAQVRLGGLVGDHDAVVAPGGGQRALHGLLRSHAPSCAVLRILMPRNTAAGQP